MHKHADTHIVYRPLFRDSLWCVPVQAAQRKAEERQTRLRVAMQRVVRSFQVRVGAFALGSPGRMWEVVWARAVRNVRCDDAQVRWNGVHCKFERRAGRVAVVRSGVGALTKCVGWGVRCEDWNSACNIWAGADIAGVGALGRWAGRGGAQCAFERIIGVWVGACAVHV